jgi:hypothetical protein
LASRRRGRKGPERSYADRSACSCGSFGLLASIAAAGSASAESPTPYRWRSVIVTLISPTAGARHAFLRHRRLRPADLSSAHVVWREAQNPLKAVPHRAGALWLLLDGALYRSIDGGGSWTRINDDRHQWGLRFA